MLALTALAALTFAIQRRHTQFTNASKKYRSAELSCSQEAFVAVKYGENPGALYAAAQRYHKAADLHEYAVWRPWILFSPQPLEGKTVRIIDELNNTTTIISIAYDAEG